MNDTTPEAAAAILYPAPPPPAPLAPVADPGIAEARQAPERRLFGDTTFVVELPDGALPGIDSREARAMFADIGASSQDVRDLVALAQKPVTDETRGKWQAETADMLARRGFTTRDVEIAKQYVSRDPRRGTFLDNGIGDSPVVIEKMIGYSRSAAAAGTFKVAS